jgi:SAM-dependent methyltransferase
MPEAAHLKEIALGIQTCLVCGGSRFRKLTPPPHPIGKGIFGPFLDEFAICRCACGMEFLNPRPAPGLLDSFYGGKAYDCHRMNRSGIANRKAEWLLNLVSRYGPYSPQKRFLDFGCGGGYLIRHALDAGWAALGFDVGEAALETCRAHGLPVTNRFGDLIPGSFDVIVMNHVLEHIEEPAGLLERLRGLLGPHGKLVIEVPNVRSARARLALPVLSRHAGFDDRHRAFPIHLWYFNPQTMRRFLRNQGFDPVLVTTVGMGLEELILRKEEEPTAPARSASTSQNRQPPSRSALSPVKNAIKKLFLNHGLGENVISLSRPALELSTCPVSRWDAIGA